jgi:hypothetical protein
LSPPQRFGPNWQRGCHLLHGQGKAAEFFSLHRKAGNAKEHWVEVSDLSEFFG